MLSGEQAQICQAGSSKGASRLEDGAEPTSAILRAMRGAVSSVLGDGKRQRDTGDRGAAVDMEGQPVTHPERRGPARQCRAGTRLRAADGRLIRTGDGVGD